MSSGTSVSESAMAMLLSQVEISVQSQSAARGAAVDGTLTLKTRDPHLCVNLRIPPVSKAQHSDEVEPGQIRQIGRNVDPVRHQVQKVLTALSGT
jgi:hypothetical protein